MWRGFNVCCRVLCACRNWCEDPWTSIKSVWKTPMKRYSVDMWGKVYTLLTPRFFYTNYSALVSLRSCAYIFIYFLVIVKQESLRLFTAKVMCLCQSFFFGLCGVGFFILYFINKFIRFSPLGGKRFMIQASPVSPPVTPFRYSDKFGESGRDDWLDGTWWPLLMMVSRGARVGHTASVGRGRSSRTHWHVSSVNSLREKERERMLGRTRFWLYLTWRLLVIRF